MLLLLRLLLRDQLLRLLLRDQLLRLLLFNILGALSEDRQDCTTERASGDWQSRCDTDERTDCLT